MTMKAQYRNSWHTPGHDMYGPVFYETEATPIEYAGCLIYQRIKGVCWDVVRDGACIAQRAGLNGAKQAVDLLFGKADEGTMIDSPEEFEDVRSDGQIAEDAELDDLQGSLENNEDIQADRLAMFRSEY